MKAIELIHWESEYSVGVAEIDAQHLDLINLINDMISLSTETRAGAKKNFIEKCTLAGAHWFKHFETEENILSKTTYEKFADHKNEHENLTAKVVNLQNILSSKEDVDLFSLIVSFKEWVLSHILLYDKEAKDFFKMGNKKL